MAMVASFNGENGMHPCNNVAVDSSGNLFGVSGSNRLFEIAQGSGVITALALLNGIEFGGVALDSSGNLFGTTCGLIANQFGTVFEIAHGGSVITTLASFNGTNGSIPQNGVVLDSSGNIFSTTSEGGTYGDGTVFEIAYGTGAISALASFNGANGGVPSAGVILDSSGDLFGTTSSGGACDDGTVFEIARGSYTITTLASFDGSNGEEPNGVVLDSSGNLFGTTRYGGAIGSGSVFAIAQGSGAITTVASFNNSTGAFPEASVTMDSSGNLFGTTSMGGFGDDGTVFEIARGSGVITTLVLFADTACRNPRSGVILDSAGNLFGTTYDGGDGGIFGAVFELTPVATDAYIGLNTSNASAVYGQPVTLTAVLSANVGIMPTGTVQFQIDGSDVAKPVAVYASMASLTVSTLSLGSHSIVADYSGDSNFPPSTGPALIQNVAKAPPSWGTLSALATFSSEVTPAAVVLDPSGDIFGATADGGDLSLNSGYGDGTIFEIANTDGVITTLAQFNGADGLEPNSAILDSSGDLFGTTAGNGAGIDGTVFEVAKGTGIITTLGSFNGTNGSNPEGGVVLDSAGNLFGTTAYGGANDDGSVFEIALGSGTISTLASFDGANGDGPEGGVVLDSSGNLLGTTYKGGLNNDGTAFEVAQGSGLITIMASFNDANGYGPLCAVLDSSGNLFGTTQYGGASGVGTAFEIAHGGGLITTLASFNYTNSTGYEPIGVVLDSSGDLLGTRNGSGADGSGAIFEIARGSGSVSTLALIAGESTTGVAFDSSGNLFGATYSRTASTVFEMAGTEGVTTSSNAPPIYGQPVTFTVTVGSSFGVPTGPTGTVQFQIDGNNVGSPVPLSGNTASYTTSTLDAGSHSIVAVYSGDGNFTSGDSPAFTQVVNPMPLTAAANAVYLKLDPDGQHVDVWNNATAAGTADQSDLISNIANVTYAGPDGGDTFVLDFSNGDPIPAGGISLTGGAGQNTLDIIGDPANASDTITINGGAFTIPASSPGAGTLNYTLGTISIAAGASLALAASDSQADETVFAVNNLAVAGTLDIANNTLLANESNVPISQITTWVQNAGAGPSIVSSLVAAPNAIASRAVGYGDWNEDPLTVPAGDVEVKYVPFGDTNLDGLVDITDLTRAINNLGLSPGYWGGDVADQELVNINDIANIINDIGANLNASGDAVGVADAAVQPSTPSARAAASPPAAGNSVGTLFSDSAIQADWLDGASSILSGQ
jgi:uncharacterized repeat protein (TIGR03803 family)